VEGEDLVADDVVARGDVLRDLEDPGEVVVHEDVGAPVAAEGALVDQAALADAHPLEGGLVDGLAVARTPGDVVDDGALVRLWPGVPLEEQLGAGLDLCVDGGGGAVGVADDVGVVELGGLDEAVVGDVDLPADDGGVVGLVGEGGGVVAAVADAVDVDPVDVAVGRDEGRRGERREDARGLDGGHVGGQGGRDRGW
jgi:hypothetical protein